MPSSQPASHSYEPAGPGVVFTPPALAARLADGLTRVPEGRAILDPACGDGALLLAALADLPWRPRSLFGIELNPAHAERARARLAAAIDPIPISQRPRVVITCADALDPKTPWPAAAVLANPPWISFSGRQRAPIAADRLERYRRAWPAMRTWPSAHAAFLERIAEHVASARRAGVTARVLLPAGVLDLERYGPLRQAVRRGCRLDGAPEELGESAFAGVLEPACLLTLVAAARRGPGSDAPWTAIAPDDAERVARLRRFPRLPPECFADPGVHTGNASRELILREPPEATRGFSESARRVASAPVRVGRDLRAFGLRAPTLALRTDLERGEARYFRIQALERYRAVPILLRQTADRPIAALHTAPTYFRNSLLACTPPPGLDPAFVVATLNSSVAAEWHRLNFRDARQRAFPQVKVSHLRSQPFPIVSRAQNPRLHDAVVECARGLDPQHSEFAERHAELEALLW